MHLVDNECGFAGSVPLVVTIPLLGAAFECQYNQTQNVAVLFCDGAWKKEYSMKR